MAHCPFHTNDNMRTALVRAHKAKGDYVKLNFCMAHLLYSARSQMAKNLIQRGFMERESVTPDRKGHGARYRYKVTKLGHDTAKKLIKDGFICLRPLSRDELKSLSSGYIY